MKAFAYRSGLIEFGNRVKPGTLFIAQHPSRKKLMNVVGVIARRGWGPSAGQLLVPGIPEAINDDAAADALEVFIKRIEERLGLKPSKRGAEAIDLGFNWQEAASIIALALERGKTVEGREIAKAELRKMARAADVARDAIKALRELVALKKIKTRCGDFRLSRPDSDSAYWNAREDYEARKPAAWRSARAVIAKVAS